MVFRWCADDSLTFNAGLVALCFLGDQDPILLGNHIFFVIFQGGGCPDSLSPPLDPRSNKITCAPIEDSDQLEQQIQ